MIDDQQTGPARAGADVQRDPDRSERAERGPRAARAPGHVPWGWRQVLQAVTIAILPVVGLYLLGAAVGGTEDADATTVPLAAATVVFTLLLDGWFVLWAWVFSLARTGLGVTSWGLRPFGRRFFWIIPAALISVYAVNAVYEVLVGTPQQQIVDLFPRGATGLALFMTLAVVIAPFFEEVVFRGFIFQGLAHSWGPIPGAIVSAALFALSHEQLGVFVPLFVLGLALTAVFYWTRSLWTSIAFHAVFNGISVLVWALTG